jgi:RND family efflux transporter MFP subunit
MRGTKAEFFMIGSNGTGVIGLDARASSARSFLAKSLLASALALIASGAAAAGFDCVIDPSLVLKLGSPLPSILSAVEVERGDPVKRGQLIARMESAIEESTVTLNEARAESTAEIEAKQAVLEQKRAVLKRKLSLQQNNIASSQDVETAQAEFNVAEQDLKLARLNRHMAQLELRRSQATLEQRMIRSPIDGIVVQRALGPGEYVHQDVNIVTVARIDPLNVEAFLPVRYYGQIKVGDAAIVRPDDPVGGDRRAEVSVVDQVFDAASGTFGIRLKLANPERIVPAGLRCRVTFELEGGQIARGREPPAQR